MFVRVCVHALLILLPVLRQQQYVLMTRDNGLKSSTVDILSSSPVF